MGDLKYLVPILVAAILVWFTYLIVNFVATIIKTKKKDETMICGVSKQGKVFYGILTVIYLVMFVYCIYYMISHLLSGDVDSVYLPLNALTIYSIAFYFTIQWIIYFGQRQVLIGRVIFDYRKIKRVSYPKKSKLRFTYGQKVLETNIRFIDDSILKKSLQRTR
nr:hypothetical protein [uncultured Faecalibacillus sp.]